MAWKECISTRFQVYTLLGIVLFAGYYSAYGPAARKARAAHTNTTELELLHTEVIADLKEKHAGEIRVLEDQLKHLRQNNRRRELERGPPQGGATVTPERQPGGDGEALQDGCNILFAVFYVAKDNRARVPRSQRYAVESAQLTHPGCPVVILSDSVSNTSDWETLGEGVSVRRLDPDRTQQLRNTSEMMLFRHLMETELLGHLAKTAQAGSPAPNVVFLDTDVLVGRALHEVFTAAYTQQHSNNTLSSFAVGLTYRSGCAGKFKDRCRMQPINTGVKFVTGSSIHKAATFFRAALRLWGRTDTSPGSQVCASMVVGEAAKQGLAAFPDDVRRHVQKRLKHASSNLFQDGMCDQAAFYKALEMYSEQRVYWGGFSKVAVPHQITLAYASGRRESVNLMFLPCYRYNAILAGRHSDDCRPNSRSTAILHFKGSGSKAKGRLLWGVLKNEKSMAAVLEAAGQLRPEP